MAQIPVDVRIGDIKNTLERAALKRESECMPDRTFRSVATDQVFSFDYLRRAVGCPYPRRDAAIILRKTLEFGIPKNIFLMSLQVFIKKPRVFALLQHKHEGKRAQSFSHIGKIEFAA